MATKLRVMHGAPWGVCIPARVWAEFLDVYYRPHLLVVNLGTSTDSLASKKLADLLRRLVESLRSTSDYAILLEENEVKFAFESELDAEVAGGLLGSRIVNRGGWASESICDFDLP